MPLKRLRKILRDALGRFMKKSPKNTPITNKYVPSDVYQQLRDGLCVVIFTKKTTQTVRRMTCTLNPKFTPRRIAKAMKSSEYYDILDRHYALGLIAVWDVEKNDWRSFYVSSIHDFKLQREAK